MNFPSIGSGFNPRTGQWKVYIAPAPLDELEEHDTIIVLGSGRTKAEAVESTVRELEAALVALKASVVN